MKSETDPDALYECVAAHYSDFGAQAEGKQLLGRDLSVSSLPDFWAKVGDDVEREAKLRALQQFVALEDLTCLLPSEDGEGPPVARTVAARDLVKADDPIVAAHPSYFARV